MIQSGIGRLIELFPSERINPADCDEYNRRTIAEFEHIRDASWVQVMLGQGIIPSDYNPMVDQLSDAQLGQFMGDVRGLIEKSVADLPTHAEYIAHNCKAD